MDKKKKQVIEIKHQLSKSIFKFSVTNQASLSDKEVKVICYEMAVHAILIEGRYYELPM